MLPIHLLGGGWVLFPLIAPLFRPVDNARLTKARLLRLTQFCYGCKTGKLSYTYWKNFEEYDQAWGMTEKYHSLVRKISKEASELDRQYKIRANAIRQDP